MPRCRGRPVLFQQLAQIPGLQRIPETKIFAGFTGFGDIDAPALSPDPEVGKRRSARPRHAIRPFVRVRLACTGICASSG